MSDEATRELLLDATNKITRAITKIAEGGNEGPGGLEAVAIALAGGTRSTNLAEAVNNVAEALNRIADALESMAPRGAK